MGSIRAYIKPFNEDGTYQDDWIDVTRSVKAVGTVKEDLDSLDFQLGVFRNSSVKIELNNRDGRFSDVGNLETIFKYTRADSLVRLTWMEGGIVPIAGFCRAEMQLSPEVEVFEGFLNDESFTENTATEEAQFQVLGFSSLFERNNVPYSEVTAGTLISDLIFQILNIPEITSYLTVDASNIIVGTDLTTDSVEFLENLSVQAALDRLLLVSNSVLYIRNRTVYVTDRTPTNDIRGRYYGQASREGIENIVSVGNIKSGLSRTYNYFYWKETNVVQSNLTSIEKNFVRRREIDFPVFTDLGKQATLLFNLLGEFKDPKKEFELEVPLYYDELERFLLDRIMIDYPTVFVPTEGFSPPVLGIALLGSSAAGPVGAVLPRGLWSLTIDAGENWKILSREINLMGETVKYKVRKI